MFIILRSNRRYLEYEDYPNQRHVVCHIYMISFFFTFQQTELSVGKFCDNADYLSART
jgi:hypothetical protein